MHQRYAYNTDDIKISKSTTGTLLKCLDASGGRATDLYFIDGAGNTQKIFSTENDFLSRGITLIKPVDIDNDGTDEISFMTYDHFGPCSGYTDYQYLYSIKENQLYSKTISAKTNVSCDGYEKETVVYSKNTDVVKPLIRAYLDKTLTPRSAE